MSVCQSGWATDDSMAHELCKCGTKTYKRKLRICNNSCFSTAKMAAQARLSVMLHVLYIVCFYLSN